MTKKVSILLVIAVAFVSHINADYCNVDGCDPGTQTLCLYPKHGPSSKCTGHLGGGVSDDLKSKIVQKHNELRQKVASGRETQGHPGPQPAAKSMPNLVWDNELQKVAQRWADQCNYGHDKCRTVDRFYAGQNVFLAWTSGDVSELDPLSGVDSWYDEVKRYNRNDVSKFTSGTDKNGKDIGHYTQLVWAKSTTIGCGLRKYTQEDFKYLFLVCNYGPGGNIPGRPVYETR